MLVALLAADGLTTCAADVARARALVAQGYASARRPSPGAALPEVFVSTAIPDEPWLWPFRGETLGEILENLVADLHSAQGAQIADALAAGAVALRVTRGGRAALLSSAAGSLVFGEKVRVPAQVPRIPIEQGFYAVSWEALKLAAGMAAAAAKRREALAELSSLGPVGGAGTPPTGAGDAGVPVPGTEPVAGTRTGAPRANAESPAVTSHAEASGSAGRRQPRRRPAEPRAPSPQVGPE
jgi:hypothetical protein